MQNSKGKSCKITKTGNVYQELNKDLGRCTVSIQGAISANNYIYFKDLRLRGSFVYIQLSLLKASNSTLHIEIATENSIDLRLTITSLYDVPRFLGSTLRLPLPRPFSLTDDISSLEDWMVLALDMNRLLNTYFPLVGVDRCLDFKYIKSIQLCSTMAVRDVITSNVSLPMAPERWPRALAVKPTAITSGQSRTQPSAGITLTSIGMAWVDLAEYCNQYPVPVFSSVPPSTPSAKQTKFMMRSPLLSVPGLYRTLNMPVNPPKKPQIHRPRDKEEQERKPTIAVVSPPVDVDDEIVIAKDASIFISGNFSVADTSKCATVESSTEAEAGKGVSVSPTAAAVEVQRTLHVQHVGVGGIVENLISNLSTVEASAEAPILPLEQETVDDHCLPTPAPDTDTDTDTETDLGLVDIPMNSATLLTGVHEKELDADIEFDTECVLPAVVSDRDYLVESPTGPSPKPTVCTISNSKPVPVRAPKISIKNKPSLTTKTTPGTVKSRSRPFSDSVNARAISLFPKTHGLKEKENVSPNSKVDNCAHSGQLMVLERVLHYTGGASVLLYGGSMLAVASGPLVVLVDVDGVAHKQCNDESPGLWKAFLDSYKGNDELDEARPQVSTQATLKGHESSVGILRVSSDHRYLLSCEIGRSGSGISVSGRGPQLIFWDLTEGSRAAALDPHGESILCAEFNQETTMLVTVGVDVCVGRSRTAQTRILLWDLTAILSSRTSDSSTTNTPEPIAKYTSEFQTTCIRFVAQADKYGSANLVSCGRENIRFWRIKQGRIVGRPVLLAEFCRGFDFTALELLETVTATQDPRLNTIVIVASSKGVVLQIDFLTEQVIGAYQLHDGAIHSMALHTDFMITGGSDCMLRIWPLDFSDFLLEARHEGTITALSLSPDNGSPGVEASAGYGVRVSVGTNVGTLGVLDLSSHSYRTILRSHFGPILYVVGRPPAFNEFTTIGGEDRTIRMWDLYSGQQKFEFQSPSDLPLVAAYHPSVHMLSCGFESGVLRVFDVDTTTTMYERQQRDVPICCLHYTPQGERLFVGAKDGQICVYAPPQGYVLVKTLAIGVGVNESIFMSMDTTGILLAVCGQSLSSPVTVLDTTTLLPLLRGCVSQNTNEKHNKIIPVAFGPDSVGPKANSLSASQRRSAFASVSPSFLGIAIIEDSESRLAILLLNHMQLICLSVHKKSSDILKTVDYHGPAVRLHWGPVSVRRLEFSCPLSMFYDPPTGLIFVPFSDKSESTKSASLRKGYSQTLEHGHNVQNSIAVFIVKLDCDLRTMLVSAVQAINALPAPVHGICCCSRPGRTISVDNSGGVIIWKLSSDNIKKLEQSLSLSARKRIPSTIGHETMFLNKDLYLDVSIEDIDNYADEGHGSMVGLNDENFVNVVASKTFLGDCEIHPTLISEEPGPKAVQVECYDSDKSHEVTFGVSHKSSTNFKFGMLNLSREFENTLNSLQKWSLIPGDQVIGNDINSYESSGFDVVPHGAMVLSDEPEEPWHSDLKLLSPQSETLYSTSYDTDGAPLTLVDDSKYSYGVHKRPKAEDLGQVESHDSLLTNNTEIVHKNSAIVSYPFSASNDVPKTQSSNVNLMTSTMLNVQPSFNNAITEVEADLITNILVDSNSLEKSTVDELDDADEESLHITNPIPNKFDHISKDYSAEEFPWALISQHQDRVRTFLAVDSVNPSPQDASHSLRITSSETDRLVYTGNKIGSILKGVHTISNDGNDVRIGVSKPANIRARTLCQQFLVPPVLSDKLLVTSDGTMLSVHDYEVDGDDADKLLMVSRPSNAVGMNGASVQLLNSSVTSLAVSKSGIFIAAVVRRLYSSYIKSYSVRCGIEHDLQESVSAGDTQDLSKDSNRCIFELVVWANLEQIQARVLEDKHAPLSVSWAEDNSLLAIGYTPCREADLLVTVSHLSSFSLNQPRPSFTIDLTKTSIIIPDMAKGHSESGDAITGEISLDDIHFSGIPFSILDSYCGIDDLVGFLLAIYTSRDIVIIRLHLEPIAKAVVVWRSEAAVSSPYLSISHFVFPANPLPVSSKGSQHFKSAVIMSLNSSGIIEALAATTSSSDTSSRSSDVKISTCQAVFRTAPPPNANRRMRLSSNGRWMVIGSLTAIRFYSVDVSFHPLTVVLAACRKVTLTHSPLHILFLTDRKLYQPIPDIVAFSQTGDVSYIPSKEKCIGTKNGHLHSLKSSLPVELSSQSGPVVASIAFAYSSRVVVILSSVGKLPSSAVTALRLEPCLSVAAGANRFAFISHTGRLSVLSANTLAVVTVINLCSHVQSLNSNKVENPLSSLSTSGHRFSSLRFVDSDEGIIMLKDDGAILYIDLTFVSQPLSNNSRMHQPPCEGHEAVLHIGISTQGTVGSDASKTVLCSCGGSHNRLWAVYNSTPGILDIFMSQKVVGRLQLLISRDEFQSELSDDDEIMCASAVHVVRRSNNLFIIAYMQNDEATAAHGLFSVGVICDFFSSLDDSVAQPFIGIDRNSNPVPMRMFPRLMIDRLPVRSIVFYDWTCAVWTENAFHVIDVVDLLSDIKDGSSDLYLMDTEKRKAKITSPEIVLKHFVDYTSAQLDMSMPANGSFLVTAGAGAINDAVVVLALRTDKPTLYRIDI